jgi:protein SCO1/2
MVVLALVVTAALTQSAAQSAAKKPHELRGKVTEVNASSKSLTVDHEAVPGWMEAMTMSYPVDKEAVLKEVKPGDQITATVYDGDLTLHNIHVTKGHRQPGK